MQQFHQEWWKHYHKSHFKVAWSEDSGIHKRDQSLAGYGMDKVAQSGSGFSYFVYLYCPPFSVPFLISAIHKATFKQVKEKKGKKLLCFLKVSRSHRVVRQSLLQPHAAGAGSVALSLSPSKGASRCYQKQPASCLLL